MTDKKQKWLFSFLFGTIIYLLHIRLSIPFLAADEYVVHWFNEIFVIASGNDSKMKIIKVLYVLLTGFTIYISVFAAYRAMFERILTKLLLNKEAEKKDNQEELIIPPFPYDRRKLQMIIGLKHNKFDTRQIENPEYLIVPEKAMFQNFLITGTIGTGKTASVMYPFLKQALNYECDDPDKKAGMLILDVKGNFYEKAIEYARECGRADDIILINLDGEYKYNPLHKPDMEPVDLAERSRQVISLFSGGGKSEKFWDTKSSQMMTECIRLLRLTRQYVTLSDIHKIVTNEYFLEELFAELNELIEKEDVELSAFDYNSCINYFQGEFNSRAENTIATIKACVTEMTGFFASSERINRAFCPPKEELNFEGFEDVVNKGKIVVLAMNVAEYPQVSRTISAYMKLDFQSVVQQRTSPGKTLNRERPVFFICDEYQEFVTANDGRFYGLSRESRCCSIVSSQSYTSILQTLGNKEAFDVLQQNLINKLWLRTDDKLTIDTAQLLTGKEEKERYGKNISENMADAKRSAISGKLVSNKRSSFSESVSVSTQKEFVFDERIFTQVLELFTCIAFTAHDKGMNEPFLIHLLPYFRYPISDFGKLEKKKETATGMMPKMEGITDVIINFNLK